MDSNGNGLSILILCKYSIHHDWQAFALWYSLYKNLPRAQVLIMCARDYSDHFAAFSWVTRVRVPFFQCKFSFSEKKEYALNLALKEKLIKLPCLAIPCNYMCIKPLSKTTIKLLNQIKYHKIEDILFLNDNLSTESMEYNPIQYLSNHADDDTSASFTDYSTIGKFNLNEWENNNIIPPFYNVNSISHTMLSFSGKKVLELWNKMVNIYDLVK